MSWLSAASSELIRKPAAEYDDPLVSTRRPAWTRGTVILLAVLVALTALPRLATLARPAPPVRDAFYYAAVAQEIVDGELNRAFSYLNLNVFSGRRAGGLACGIAPLGGGSAISLIAAILTPLPLFAWVRRMYDDRVAAAACLLFAIHPRLVRVATEPLRESLFFLLFAWGLLLFWRASVELKLRHFLLAGLAMTLTIHTRSEGWLLVVAAVGWAAGRWWVDRGAWKELLIGLSASFAVLPAALLLVNVTLLAGHDRWEAGRLAPLELVFGWSMAIDRNLEPLAEENAQKGIGPALPEDWHTGSDTLLNPDKPALGIDDRPLFNPYEHRRPLTKIFINDLSDALNPAIALCMLLALFRWRHLVFRRDKLVLLAMVLLVAVAIMLRQERAGHINGRYFFTVFIIAAGCAGQGLLLVSSYVLRLLRGNFAGYRVAFAGSLLVGGMCFSAWWQVTNDDPYGYAEKELGEWMATVIPQDRRIAAIQSAGRVALYAHPQPALRLVPSNSFAKRVEKERIDTVLVETFFSHRPMALSVTDRLLRRGFRPVPLPDTRASGNFVLLRRDPSWRPSARLARQTETDGTHRSRKR